MIDTTTRRRLPLSTIVVGAAGAGLSFILLVLFLVYAGMYGGALQQRATAEQRVKTVQQQLAAEQMKNDQVYASLLACSSAYDDRTEVATELRSLIIDLSQRTSDWLGDLLTNPAPLDIDDLTSRASSVAEQDNTIDGSACS